MNLTDIRHRLNEQNFRLTIERQVLLELFVESSKVYTPLQLHEVAKAHHLSVGLTTVYRLLEALTKVGAATPFLVDGSIFYAYCGAEHHHHFVCLSCYQVVNVQGDCPRFEVPDNYRVLEHRSDLFGTCPNCQ